MATPRSSERLEASDSSGSCRSAVDEQTEKGRRNVAQKFLHSKAVRLMTGGKKRGNGSVTLLTEQEHPPADVQTVTVKHTAPRLCQPDHDMQKEDRLCQLELDNKRFQREKDVMVKNMMKYEDQLATKEQEIRELRKRCASVPQHAHVPGPAKNNGVNQELSEYLRDAHVTQLSSDKDLLEYQLHEARTEYKTMLSQNLSNKLLMEEKIKSLEKQIQNMLREKEELLAMVKTLTAEKKASNEFFWKQVQNSQEQSEQMLKSVQNQVTHPPQSHDQECHELQTVRSQLEDSSAKVTAPEQAKQVVQNDLDEEKKEREVLVALDQKLEKENKDEEQCQQQLRQEVETLKQQLTAAQQEAAHSSQHVTELTEEKKRTAEEYKIKQADMQQQIKQLQLQLSTAREEAVCSSQQLTELTKEKNMIKEVYENEMAELRGQLVAQQDEMKQREESAMSTGTVEGLGEEKERGRGCYGAVYEVRVDGVPCIAKRLHDILVGRKGMEPVGDEQQTAAIKCFRRECALMSGLRHPNVVQFMGVHCGSDEADISLIMEYMLMDLGDCIKKYPDIPLPYKTSILRDVVYGLAYLHSRNIIHRDLNAGNILLTESLRAKIADLGMSKLFDRKVVMQRTKTVCPGALDFMPPESLTKAPKYSDKLDIFSFGHLTVNLVNQEEPHVDDSSIVSEDVERKQIQFGKRREALDQMSHQLSGSQHPLYSTVVQCLSDTPDQRPTSRDLVKRMEEICQQHPIPHKNTLETLTIVATLRSSSKEQEAVLKEMEQHNTQLKSSNQVLQSRLVATQSKSSELQQQCGTLQQEVELVRGQCRELEEKNTQLKSSNQVFETCYRDVRAAFQQMETQLGPVKQQHT